MQRSWAGGYASTTVDRALGRIAWEGEGARMGIGWISVLQTFEDFRRSGVPSSVPGEIAAPPPDVVAWVSARVDEAWAEVEARSPDERLAQVVPCADAATARALLARGAAPRPIGEALALVPSVVLSGWSAEDIALALVEAGAPPGPTLAREAASRQWWRLLGALLDRGATIPADLPLAGAPAALRARLARL